MSMAEIENNGGSARACAFLTSFLLTSLAVAGAFFIFDNLIESETADPAECPLFFHPASMPVNLQSFLLGYVSAMAVFVEGFGSAVSVIQLQRSKMAVRKAEGVTLVLVGRANESDLAVRQHLDDVYSAFCFFYGSLGAVIASHGGGTRAELLKAMRRVGEELLPLIDNYSVTPFSSFDPLPYAPLRPHSGRVVVQAAQLLSSVAFPGHLGGAVFCATPGPGLCNVVATALPVDATRWVGVRVSHVADSMALGGRGAPLSLAPDDALLNSQCDLLNVMISTQLRDQLRADAAHTMPLLQAEEWGALTSSSSSSSLLNVSGSGLVPLSGADLLQALNLPQVPHGSCYAGLLIVYVGSLSAALLMELDQLYDEHHMQRVRALCDARLVRLEQEMRLLHCLATPSSGSTDSADSDATVSASSSSAGSGALPDASPSPFKPNSSASSLRRRAMQSGGVPAPSHWVFVHDGATGSSLAASSVGGAVTSSGRNVSALHTELLAQANAIHDHFAVSPASHQLSLRAADRSLYCKRVGRKEMYLMQSPPPASCFDVEAEAKKTLYDEYGIRIL